MGSRAELNIGGVCFDSWKDGVDPTIMVLFSESEKRCTRYPVAPEAENILDEGEEWPFYKVQYRSTIQTFKKRLEFFGFTLDVAKRVFDIAKQEEIKDTNAQLRFGLTGPIRSKRLIQLSLDTGADWSWYQVLTPIAG